MGEGEAHRTERVPLHQRIAFGSGNFINVLAVSMWFPYNVTFFQKVLQLPPKSTGTIILIAQLAGAVSTPFIGLWSDQARCRYGRRKVFHLIGVIAVACSFFFIWHDCFGCTDVPDQYQVLYFSSFAIIFEFGWAAVQIAQLSVIPELTSDKHMKVELNAIRYTFAITANIIVFSCIWGLLERFNSSSDVANLSPDDKKIFWIMAIVVIVAGIPMSMLFQIFIHEDPNAIFKKLKWFQWLMKPEFYLVACTFVAARIAVLLSQTYLPLYLLDTLKMDRSSIAKGPLTLYLTSFVVTFILKHFNKTVGDKMTFFLGLTVVWGALIWFWVKDPTDDSVSGFNVRRDSIYGATILLGAGGATLIVISMTMIAYLVGDYIGSSAFVYGWVSFFDRLSNGVTVKIIQQFQSDNNVEFYRHVLVFVPFAATALGLFTITAMFFLRWPAHKEYRPKSTSWTGCSACDHCLCNQSDGEGTPLSVNTLKEELIISSEKI